MSHANQASQQKTLYPQLLAQQHHFQALLILGQPPDRCQVQHDRPYEQDQPTECLRTFRCPTFAVKSFFPLTRRALPPTIGRMITTQIL